MLWLIILLLVVVVILLLYLIFTIKRPQCSSLKYTEFSQKLQKVNDFMQDLCVHIDEKESYIIIPGEKDIIKGNQIYLNFTDDSRDYHTIYITIISLVANDICKKHNNKDIDATVIKLEQIAYNLGYLTTEI